MLQVVVGLERRALQSGAAQRKPREEAPGADEYRAAPVQGPQVDDTPNVNLRCVHALGVCCLEGVGFRFMLTIWNSRAHLQNGVTAMSLLGICDDKFPMPA